MKIALYVLLFLLILVFVDGLFFKRNGKRRGLKIRRTNVFGRLSRGNKPRNRLQKAVRNAADKILGLVKPLKKKKSRNRTRKTKKGGEIKRLQYTDLGSSPVSPENIQSVGATRELSHVVGEKNPTDYSNKPKQTAVSPFEPGYKNPSRVPEIRPGDYSGARGRALKPSLGVDLIPPEAYVDTQSSVSKRPQDYVQRPDIVASPRIPKQQTLPITISDKTPDYGRKPVADTVLPETYVETQGSVDPLVTATRPKDYSQQAVIDPILPDAYTDPRNLNDGSSYDLPTVLDKRPTDYGRKNIVDPPLSDGPGGYVEPITTNNGYSPDAIADPVRDTMPRDYGQQPVIDPILPEAYVDPQNPGGGPGIGLPTASELRPADYGRRLEPSVLTDVSTSSGYTAPDVISATDIASKTRDGYAEPSGTNNEYVPDTVPVLPEHDPIHGNPSDATTHTGPEVLEVIEDPVFHGMNRRIFQQGGENFQGVACQIGGCKDGLHCVVVNTGNILETCVEGSWDLCKCIKGCVVSTGILVEGRVRGKTCRSCRCRAGKITCRSGRVCSM